MTGAALTGGRDVKFAGIDARKVYTLSMLKPSFVVDVVMSCGEEFKGFRQEIPLESSASEVAGLLRALAARIEADGKDAG